MRRSPSRGNIAGFPVLLSRRLQGAERLSSLLPDGKEFSCLIQK